MIKTIFFSPDGTAQYDLPIDQVLKHITDNEGLSWINMEQPTDAETHEILSDYFHFHHLAIEDCLSGGYQTPKIDDFNSYLFIITHAVRNQGDFGALETSELNIFLGNNYLVSYYKDGDISPASLVWQRLSRDERLHQSGADFLCHAILDAVVDDYMPLLDKIEDEIDVLEDVVLEKPRPSTLQRILQLKHVIMTLRRIISPQREVINRLSRDEFPQIDQHSRIYFRDIYDHIVRIQDLTESLRDIIAGDLDIYLNATSLRLNEIMKALAVVSTIFLPLSFVAGVYGMNFQHMPELSQTWTYPMIWLVFIAIGGGMLLFFKKRGWF